MKNNIKDGQSNNEFIAPPGKCSNNKSMENTIASDSNPNGGKSESNEKEKLWSMLLTQNKNVKKDDLSSSSNQPNKVVATFMKNVVSNEKLIENEPKIQKISDIPNVSSKLIVDTTPNDGIKFIKAMGQTMQTTNNIGQKPASMTDCTNSDSDGCTDTLKKWLRINDDKSTSSLNQSVSKSDATPINFQDMIRIDTYNLPKPPQTWRTESAETKPEYNSIKPKVYPDNNEKKMYNKSGSRLFYASPNVSQYNGAPFHQNIQNKPHANQNLIYHPQPQVQQGYQVPPPPHMFNRQQIQPNFNFYQQSTSNFNKNNVSK